MMGSVVMSSFPVWLYGILRGRLTHTNTRTLFAMGILTPFTWLLLAGSCNALLASPNRLRNKASTFGRPSRDIRRNPSLSMYLDGVDTELSSHLMTMSFSMPVSALSITTSAIVSDPSVEAELLNDIAHVGLDLATFLGPATAILRLAAVIGRMCAIGSDYLPDHSMLPSEMIFQGFMLWIAASGFWKSALPMALGLTAQTDFRDARVYQTVFGKAGISWMQYKAMRSYSMEWVTVGPNVAITSDEHSSNSSDEDDCVYWLYRGDALVSSAGQPLMKLTQGLLGERRLARSLEKKKQQQDGAMDGRYPKTTILAGGVGATVLRIRASKLTTLMDHDPDLAHSMRSLLLKGMEEKLHAVLTARNGE